MTTMREAANKYEAPKTLNICELQKVSTEIDIQHKVVGSGTPDAFEYDFISVSGKDYRVPKTVIKQLKQQLSIRKDAVWFKVLRDGTGMNTEYTVVLL
jgi:hypothetical protein